MQAQKRYLVCPAQVSVELHHSLWHDPRVCPRPVPDEVEDEHKDDMRQKLGMPWLEWSRIPGLRGLETSVIGSIPLETIQAQLLCSLDPRFLTDCSIISIFASEAPLCVLSGAGSSVSHFS